MVANILNIGGDNDHVTYEIISRPTCVMCVPCEDMRFLLFPQIRKHFWVGQGGFGRKSRYAIL